ncbi:MAG TPA: lamin tail domain-containing protein [Candidatus Kapabacteria bacterium]
MRISILIFLLFCTAATHAQVVINELMYAPRAPEPEWVELYSSEEITAENWTISDEAKTVKIPNFTIPTKSFAILTKDSAVFAAYYPMLQGVVVSVPSFPSFNNDDDVVVLKDANGAIIDSVHYYNSWHYHNEADNRGYSLERRSYAIGSTDSLNWSTPLDTIKATPLAPNSLAKPTTTLPSIDVTCTPNPFSPDGDGYNDEAIIEITIPSTNEELVSVYLYDLEGHNVATVARDRRIVGKTSITFDGRNVDGKILSMGLYSLIVSSSNTSLGQKKIGVVIAKRKM